MPTYYTVIPGYEQWSAEVDAYNKRKARTRYLDLLTRKLEVIPYSRRGAVRDSLVVERVEPGSTGARYHASYTGGLDEAPTTAAYPEGFPPVRGFDYKPTAEELAAEPFDGSMGPGYPERGTGEPVPETLPTETPIAQVPPMSARSPIMNISRRSGGS